MPYTTAFLHEVAREIAHECEVKWQLNVPNIISGLLQVYTSQEPSSLFNATDNPLVCAKI